MARSVAPPTDGRLMTARKDRWTMDESVDITGEVGELTAKLVATPSHEDETAAGDVIEAWLQAEADGSVTRDSLGNVIARRGGGDRSLALIGHHDVVPPDEQQVNGDTYVVEERNGRIYGRGAADMKGSVAAAMVAFRDATPAKGTELLFASFVGEEVGGTGARHAIEHGFTPDHAIVAEGSTNYSTSGVTDVAIAHRGRRASTLIAHGSAAHASEPEAGVNAVYRACDAVNLVRELAPPEVEVFGDIVRGSLVITGIEGGTAWNIVPKHCTVTIDERTVPGGGADLETVEASIEGVEWIVEQDLPPMACSDEAFATQVLAVAREVQVESNAVPQQVVKPHATDAGWLAQAGTACVIYGASEPGEAHTKTESVAVAVLDRCYRVYRRVASSGVEF
jgi:acetylornithine deacetylase